LLEDRESATERAPTRVTERAVERQLEYDAPRSADQRPPVDDRAANDDRRVIRSNNKDVRP
jgi:hypothetical protein